MTDFYGAQLVARKIMDETGMTLAEVASLPMDEYLRLSGRPSVGQIAAQAAGYEERLPGIPLQEQAPAQPAQAEQQPPQGIDPNSQEYFLAWRANRVSGGEGKGIFDSVGSRSQAYISAVRAQAGRTAMSNANVQEAPRLEGRYLRQNEMRDYRSAADRFSTPGNAFGL